MYRLSLPYGNTNMNTALVSSRVHGVPSFKGLLVICGSAQWPSHGFLGAASNFLLSTWPMWCHWLQWREVIRHVTILLRLGSSLLHLRKGSLGGGASKFVVPCPVEFRYQHCCGRWDRFPWYSLACLKNSDEKISQIRSLFYVGAKEDAASIILV